MDRMQLIKSLRALGASAAAAALLAVSPVGFTSASSPFDLSGGSDLAEICEEIATNVEAGDGGNGGDAEFVVEDESCWCIVDGETILIAGDGGDGFGGNGGNASSEEDDKDDEDVDWSSASTRRAAPRQPKWHRKCRGATPPRRFDGSGVTRTRRRVRQRCCAAKGEAHAPMAFGRRDCRTDRVAHLVHLLDADRSVRRRLGGGKRRRADTTRW
jgi:hypothetical protein